MMYKIFKMVVALFAILGIVAVLAVGTKACKNLVCYKDNLSTYGQVLNAMSEEQEEQNDYVVAIMM